MDWAFSHLGKGYSWLDIFSNILHVLHIPIFIGSKDAFDCSEFVGHYFDEVGVDLGDYEEDCSILNTDNVALGFQWKFLQRDYPLGELSSVLFHQILIADGPPQAFGQRGERHDGGLIVQHDGLAVWLFGVGRGLDLKCYQVAIWFVLDPDVVAILIGVCVRPSTWK